MPTGLNTVIDGGGETGGGILKHEDTGSRLLVGSVRAR